MNDHMIKIIEEIIVMCIYLRNRNDLTYNKREHVIPAGLGCKTMLDNGVVSDQANEYFSPLECSLMRESFVKIPRIMEGPGKRGSKSPMKATESEIVSFRYNGKRVLGYIKHGDPYLLNQFIYYNPQKMIFISREIEDYNQEVNSRDLHSNTTVTHNMDFNGYASLIQDIKDKILNSDIKDFCYVNLDDIYIDEICISVFRKKVYVGYHGKKPSDKIILEIQAIFGNEFNVDKNSSVSDNVSGILPIKNDLVKIAKVVAKTAINTLAYIMGEDMLLNTNDFNSIISMIFANNNNILQRVIFISTEEADKYRNHFFLKGNEHSSIIIKEKNNIWGIVFFYSFGCRILLTNELSISFPETPVGIICDWKSEGKHDWKLDEWISLHK